MHLTVLLTRCSCRLSTLRLTAVSHVPLVINVEVLSAMEAMAVLVAHHANPHRQYQHHHLDLLVLSDQTFTLTICPSTDVQNTQIRQIKYQIVDVNENPVIGAVSIREQFASKSAESCGTTVSTSETCTLANSAFVDNLTVGCNSIGGSCGHTYTRQTWQWCGPSTSLSIGAPGDIVVHNDLISVGGNFIFIPGTDIFP